MTLFWFQNRRIFKLVSLSCLYFSNFCSFRCFHALLSPFSFLFISAVHRYCALPFDYWLLWWLCLVTSWHRFLFKELNRRKESFLVCQSDPPFWWLRWDEKMRRLLEQGIYYGCHETICPQTNVSFPWTKRPLKGLSHEIDFKNFDKNEFDEQSDRELQFSRCSDIAPIGLHKTDAVSDWLLIKRNCIGKKGLPEVQIQN